jgi:integrase
MPRPKNAKPTYRYHRPTNTARCWLNGRWHSLGAFDSPESHARFARLVGGGDAAPADPAAPSTGLTVAELCLLWMRHAERHYRKPDGKPTSEIWNMKYVVGVLRELYPKLAAAEFTPLKLKAARQRMVDERVCRTQVNKHVGRIRLIYKWAASEELVPESVPSALAMVAGLQRGRCSAVETDPVGPVADAVLTATLPHLPPAVAGMVRFQRLTGCRSGEACQLRMCDIDRSGDVWVYRPRDHKTAHRGRDRVIAIGPRAQAVLAEFVTDDPAAPVFGAHTSTSYATAVRRALKRANRSGARDPERGPALPPVPHWHPHQIRHAVATQVRSTFGLDASQVVLGHSHAATSEIYAARDIGHAMRVAAEIG